MLCRCSNVPCFDVLTKCSMFWSWTHEKVSFYPVECCAHAFAQWIIVIHLCSRSRVAVPTPFAVGMWPKWPHLKKGIWRSRAIRLLSLSSFESISVICSLWSIMRSPEVIRGQIIQRKVIFCSEMCHYLRTYYSYDVAKKELDCSSTALSCECHQKCSNFGMLGDRVQERSKGGFGQKCFLQILLN